MASLSFQADYGDQTSISPPTFFEQEVFEEVGSEIEEWKIMSPELALQRERAYVAKVTKLQSEVLDSDVSAQEPPLSLILDRAPLQENLSNLPTKPSYLRQTDVEQTLQTHPLENLPQLPPPELQKAKHTFQSQTSGGLPLVPPLNQQKYKHIFESQSSGSHPGITPPYLQKAKQTPQIQSSQNPPFVPLPQSQLQQNFQIQSSETLHCVPPSQLQTSKQNFQIQSPETLHCLPPSQLQTCKQNFQIQPVGPPQLQQPYSRQTIPIQSSENLSIISQPQMQQSYTTEPLKFQSSGNPSRTAPIQMRHSYANRKSEIQPLSLVCKDCLVVCSSASTLKQHYKGRKHRTRVQELNMQRNIIQSSANQKAVIEPLWCDVCRIRCMNEDCFWQHLKGKKHTDCVQAINAVKRP